MASTGALTCVAGRRSLLANPRWRSLVGRVPNGFAEVDYSGDEPDVDS